MSPDLRRDGRERTGVAGWPAALVRFLLGGGARPRVWRLVVIVAALWVGVSCTATTHKSSVSRGDVGTAHVLLQTLKGEPSRLDAGRGARASGYPLVLIGLAVVSPGTRAGLACWTERRAPCTMSMLHWVIVAQYFAALGILAMVFRIGVNLSDRNAIGILALALTFFSTRPGVLAGQIVPAIWYAFFLSLYLVLLTEAHKHRSWPLAMVSGCALGLAVLFEPLSALLIPLSAMQLLFTSKRPGQNKRRASPVVASGLFLLAATFFVAAPLMGLFVLAYDSTPMLRYFAIGVSQRMAFIDLDRSTWLAALISPIPVLGNMISALLPDVLAEKTGVGLGRGSLITIGSHLLYPDAYARSGEAALATAGLLIREGLIERPLAYLISIPPALARGLFGGGGIIALLGLFHLRRMFAFARADNRLCVHLLVFVPIIALFAINVLATHNSYWLNPLLPFLYAYSLAYVAGGW